MSATPTKPLIFFVPGAWHDHSCFSHIRRELETRGFETDATDLATVGSADPKVGLLDDAQKVRKALRPHVEAGKNVIVLAHSFGGFVSSNAVYDLGAAQRKAEGKEGGVQMLVFLASAFAGKGQSIMSALGGHTPPFWDTSVPGLVSVLTPEHVFYNDVSPELTAAAIASLKSMPEGVTGDVAEHSAWEEGITCGYIFTLQDRAVPIEGQKAVFEMYLPKGTWNATVDSSHSPFLSMPDKLADKIVEAVKSVQRNGD
ncbi:Alpha/Beta hydrolase protein [Xylariaceae sp. FL1019]|nr:Alpha/Beta hydrolase protein [Xylariaceae sp. FL1019]